MRLWMAVISIGGKHSSLLAVATVINDVIAYNTLTARGSHPTNVHVIRNTVLHRLVRFLIACG